MGCLFKNLKIKIKFLFTILLVFTLVFFINCKSIPAPEATKIECSLDLPINEDDKCFELYENDFQVSTDEEKFIFIRLYQPYYDNPFCVENILKQAIKSVNVYEIADSHSAIGFDLNDKFYGLTIAGKQDLKEESCVDISTNPYMKKCNPNKSIQVTYALKVSKEEYENSKKMVLDYFNDPKTVYSIPQNFSYAAYGINRKYFSKMDNKKFAAKPNKKPEKTFKQDQHQFVCSSFIAYVLANNVQSVKDFFIENKINSNYVFPTDLVYIPGVKKLFQSNWIDFSLAAKEYCNFYPIFSDYLSFQQIQ